ncbi:hypothetical protein LCGC14_2543540, partial [marine sediment metagenome]
MPRKRQIDPDIWKSEQFLSLSRDGRLLFICMFSNADDDGRLHGSGLSLKILAFPVDDLSVSDVATLRDNIGEQGLCQIYNVDGYDYVSLPKFKKHQYISHYYPSKLPAPPTTGPPQEHDRKGTGTFPPQSNPNDNEDGIDNDIGNGVEDDIGDGVDNGANTPPLPPVSKEDKKTIEIW